MKISTMKRGESRVFRDHARVVEAGIRLTQEVHSRTLAVALETMHAALGKVKP